MPYCMGIDIGSGTSKGVIVEKGNVVASHSRRTGINYAQAAAELTAALLAAAGLKAGDIGRTAATGQGAASVNGADATVSDLRCCARGIYKIFPEAGTVIDIEGQITQVMRLGEGGRLAGFTTSEKCASGSGRFLDIIANVLQIPLEEIGPLSLKSKHPVAFTTACAVFGESEAVSRVAEGTPPQDILAGVHMTMAQKIHTMTDRVGLAERCAVCGGGARNTGLVRTLEDVLGMPLLVPKQPHLVTALGAALFAAEAVS